MPRATNSLPVPDSPVMSTVEDTGANCTTRSSTSLIASVSPTIPANAWRRRRSITLRATNTTSSARASIEKTSR